LDTVAGGRPLVAIGLRAFEKLLLPRKLKIDPLQLAKFLGAVEDGYVLGWTHHFVQKA
jgi:hypothetical protein